MLTSDGFTHGFERLPHAGGKQPLQRGQATVLFVLSASRDDHMPRWGALVIRPAIPEISTSERKALVGIVGDPGTWAARYDISAKQVLVLVTRTSPGPRLG